jgi:hypothetical protein
MKRIFGRFDATSVLLAVIAIVLVGAYWATVSLSQEYYVVEAPAGSVFAASPDGLRVLHGYLDRLGIERDTLQDFDELPEGATIVAVAPDPLDKEPTPVEIRRLEDWVGRGGRLVLVGPFAGALAGPGFGGSPGTGVPTVALRPRVPSAFTDGVERVAVDGDRILLDSATWVTHLKDTGGQVLANKAYGRGQVVWLSSAYPLTNEGIAEADNARLATLLVAGGGPVLFDEYHHGFVRGAGVWERLGASGRSALVLVVVAVAVGLVSAARRLGPAIETPVRRDVRTGAYMASLAELYRKAGVRGPALHTLAEGLRESLVRRYGTLEVGLARHPAASSALGTVTALAGETLSEERFVSIARDIARARQEVEGRDG